MKEISGARDIKRRANDYLSRINELADRPFSIMEVCGTHTMSIAKNALADLLPENVRLISGPGCPVCVTDNSDIDRLLYLAAYPGVITATFGDMIRVPGSRKSLQILRGEGADVRIVYSTLDALELARKNPDKEVVFLGVGFETTAPTVGISILTAQKEGLYNYSVLSMHKLVPPILRALVNDPQLIVDAFLHPGHVCAIIGAEPIKFMASEFKKAGVIAGFEALDILKSVYMLLKQRAEGRSEIEIEYASVVKPEGNLKAQAVINQVFEVVDSTWRGMGNVVQSGLGIRLEYADWDAAKKFRLPAFNSPELPGCRCGDVLKGIISPMLCPLFDSICTPLNPVGPCMVSSEGTCAAYARYLRRRVGNE